MKNQDLREWRGPVKVPRAVVPRWTLPGAIYAYRTRKSHAVLGLPIIGRHWGYVGQTRNERARHEEHLQGGGRYGKPAAPWSDLRPRRYVLFRAKRCPQWVLNLLELMFILILMPVYNEKLNKANPRRISRPRAARQRLIRGRLGWCLALHGGHWFSAGILAAVIIGLVSR
jgi:hypothetical protein